MPSAAPASEIVDAARQVTIVAARGYLPLRVRPAVPLTNDQLYAFCQQNRELRIERSSDGELIIMPPTGTRTGNRNFDLVGQFHAWVKRDATGLGFDSSTGFLLPNGAERSPDMSWVKKERWEAIPDEDKDKFAPLCPDFVVELRSPSDSLDEQRAKLDEYLACGARLGWLIDPVERRVHVYRPDTPAEVLDAPDRLRGDPELPGFVLDLTSVW